MSENQPNGDGQPEEFEISPEALDQLLKDLVEVMSENGTYADVVGAQILSDFIREPGTRGDVES